MNNKIMRIISDASWMPYSLDAGFEHINFVKTTREQVSAAAFLDNRFLTEDNEMQTFPIRDLIGLDIGHFVKPSFIFHSAFCCSTLMAGALNISGKVLVLKEPEIIMSLANAKRMFVRINKTEQDYQTLSKLIIELLSRRFMPQEAIVIKATNAANNLVEDIRAMKIPFIMMQSSLEDFLVSVLKKGESCKSFIRNQYNIFTLDPGPLSQINPRQAMTLTDLQVACLVWRHQMQIFEQQGKGQSIINDQDFLREKDQTILLVADALGLGMTSTDVTTLMASGFFSKNSKFKNENLNTKQRTNEAKDVFHRYQSEITDTLNWNKHLTF